MDEITPCPKIWHESRRKLSPNRGYEAIVLEFVETHKLRSVEILVQMESDEAHLTRAFVLDAASVQQVHRLMHCVLGVEARQKAQHGEKWEGARNPCIQLCDATAAFTPRRTRGRMFARRWRWRWSLTKDRRHTHTAKKLGGHVVESAVSTKTSENTTASESEILCGTPEDVRTTKVQFCKSRYSWFTMLFWETSVQDLRDQNKVRPPWKELSAPPCRCPWTALHPRQLHLGHCHARAVHKTNLWVMLCSTVNKQRVFFLAKKCFFRFRPCGLAKLYCGCVRCGADAQATCRSLSSSCSKPERGGRYIISRLVRGLRPHSNTHLTCTLHNPDDGRFLWAPSQETAERAPP